VTVSDNDNFHMDNYHLLWWMCGKHQILLPMTIFLKVHIVWCVMHLQILTNQLKTSAFSAIVSTIWWQLGCIISCTCLTLSLLHVCRSSTPHIVLQFTSVFESATWTPWTRTLFVCCMSNNSSISVTDLFQLLTKFC
jgi:hypothetical protein